MLIYIPSSIISLIYIFVKYIVVYKKTDKHTKARREKIMIEKQKEISELVSLFLENYPCLQCFVNMTLVLAHFSCS